MMYSKEVEEIKEPKESKELTKERDLSAGDTLTVVMTPLDQLENPIEKTGDNESNKLTLNVKGGVIQEALVETVGCSGMTHSAAMASEILPGRTILEALNTDLVCDAINTAMRELFLQIVYGRSQTAFSEGGLPIGAGLEDLGKGLRSQVQLTEL